MKKLERSASRMEDEDLNVQESLGNKERTKEHTAVIALLKKEAKIVLIVLAALLIVFKIVFYNESVLVVGRTVLGFFWLFVLPGYGLMLFWREKLDFLERLVLGTTAAVALISLASYYLTLGGLLGIHWQWIALPAVIELLIGGIIFYRLKKIN